MQTYYPASDRKKLQSPMCTYPILVSSLFRKCTKLCIKISLYSLIAITNFIYYCRASASTGRYSIDLSRGARRKGREGGDKGSTMVTERSVLPINYWCSARRSQNFQAAPRFRSFSHEHFFTDEDANGETRSPRQQGRRKYETRLAAIQRPTEETRGPVKLPRR